jgi:hypothetical protein
LDFTLLLHTVKYSELQLNSQCEVLRGLIRINNPYTGAQTTHRDRFRGY